MLSFDCTSWRAGTNASVMPSANAAFGGRVANPTAIAEDITSEDAGGEPPDAIPGADVWKARSEADIKAYFAATKIAYFEYVNAYSEYAGHVTTQYRQSSRRHLRSQIAITALTAVLTIVNVLAAATAGTVRTVLTVSAACMAALLTALGTIFTLQRFGERANGFREARELLLDQYSLGNFDWRSLVEPHGETAEGCARASKLCRQMARADCVLRQRIKRLIEGEAKPRPCAYHPDTANLNPPRATESEDRIECRHRRKRMCTNQSAGFR